jgi:type 1 glutamine amidotransferase
MKLKTTLMTWAATCLALQAQIVYQGEEGPGKGKHIVFVASDHEYRTEESCPALARILAKHHGFKCTVLFGVDEKGYIEAGASNIKGLEALKDADAMVIFARFLDLPDAQMKHIVDFVESGKPVAGLRTSSHAFKIPKGKTYSKFDFKYKGEDYHNGFGEQVLGNTWVGHHGRNHKQGTRILLEASQKKHPVLRGVEDNAFCHAGGYVGIAGDDFTVLAKSQPLVSMDPKAAADPKKAAMPSAWVRHYKGKNGQKGRVFHSTQGASEDLLDASYRRLVINGVFWINGLEDAIKADNKVDFVGPYKPSTFKFGGHVKGVKPTDLQDYDSPIMPQK